MSSKHHYLPQFYLKGFVDSECKQLYYCKKEYKKYKSVSTAGIYYKEGLNSIEFGDNFFDLEKEFFFEKDNKYANAFNKLKGCNYDVNEIHLQTKADIIEFVLGLYWRVPGGLDNVRKLIEHDGLFTGDLQLLNRETNHIYTDEEVPNIINDIKTKEFNLKSFMPIFYDEIIRKHDWNNINNKFTIFEVSQPLIIGDIPFIPLKSENKRNKILEEFIIPIDKNHILIYANKTPRFLEANFIHLINLYIINGASEKIACSDLSYLKNVMGIAETSKMNFHKLGYKEIPIHFISSLMEFESQFHSYEDFLKYYNSMMNYSVTCLTPDHS